MRLEPRQADIADIIFRRKRINNGLNQNWISSWVTCLNIECDYLRFALIDNAQCLFTDNWLWKYPFPKMFISYCIFLIRNLIVHAPTLSDAPTILQVCYPTAQNFGIRIFVLKNFKLFNFFPMKVFDLLVLGPVVNAAGELRIQLPGRNGERFWCHFVSLFNQC